MNASSSTAKAGASEASAPGILEIWPKPVQIALAVLLCAVLVFIAAHVFFGDLRDARPTELEQGAFPTAVVDLNKAEKALLRQLPEVGEKLAERIDEYRRSNGGFRSVEELTNVSGIGRVKLTRIRPWVFVEDDEGEEEEGIIRTVSMSEKKRQPAETRTRKGEALKGPVDVNEASIEKLQQVPGIGRVIAGRIVEARKQKQFESVNDLRRVPGIGPKILEKIRPFVTVVKKRVA